MIKKGTLFYADDGIYLMESWTAEGCWKYCNEYCKKELIESTKKHQAWKLKECSKRLYLQECGTNWYKYKDMFYDVKYDEVNEQIKILE